MLNENIKSIRKSKGLSQEEFAVKINVVRQTVSKWERGLSVPDSDMLVTISEVLETPVSVLLGEKITETEPDDLKAIAEKLEVINLQLAHRKTAGRNILRWGLILVCVLIVIGFVILLAADSPYLEWNYKNPELAAAGTILHGIEFVFVRVAPLILIAAVMGLILTRHKS
ncbi:MAG: helix-turn-helix transcriptional regulator [Oscillospiraceae bacterium]|nr:helix-turn-helix transcriptional regulator [Oscillospiraceae bacterium]